MARIGTFAERSSVRRRCWCRSERRCRGRRRRLWAAACPTGVGAVTRCAQVEAGASVVVIGCGGVGLNVVQGARLAGARMIVACDLLDNKLAYAKEFGATHTLNAAHARRGGGRCGGYRAVAAPTSHSTPSAAR